MSTAQVLSQADYESLIRAGLLRLPGFTPEMANSLLAARWPMGAIDMLAECAGRGRLLVLEDVAAWLESRFDQAVEPDALGYGPKQVDELLEWACEHDVGRVTFSGYIATDHPDMVDEFCTRERAPWN